MAGYGRTDAEWDELVEAATAFLAERARMGRHTTPTELNETLAHRTGRPEFAFSQEADRAAMAHLLELVTSASLEDSGGMLSALVASHDGRHAAPGFFALAERLRLLPAGATVSERDAFWSQQINSVYRAHKGRPRRWAATG